MPHLECDVCGERRATVRTGVHVAHGIVWLLCLRCRLPATMIGGRR